MLAFETWLAGRSKQVAALINRQQEPICTYVAERLETSYATLCYDPVRPDARSFQVRAFSETPRRYHRLMQAALRFNSLQIIEREYYWAWNVLVRHRIERHHLQAQVRWYYQGVREYVDLEHTDVANFETFTSHVLLIIDRVTGHAPGFQDPRMPRGNGHSQGVYNS
ncbi:MAG TPA: hypothetical protein PKA05_02215 [Roseiflexaceae bacterium]|nr:hypothetical protein [Roseiflexaceae bacterium]HMP39169.1 hypothetical protein [Roseiflexaceae bacterium]